MTGDGKRATDRFPLLVALVAIVAMAIHGPIVQPSGYHDFADTRAWLGLPNACDVLSNAGFALVGIWGLSRLRAHRREPSLATGWPGHELFLTALVLTAVGSAYYHWAPDSDRLVWDRLPIALACAGLLAAARAETREGTRVWVWTATLAVAAVASVLWWALTDRAGLGDLRPYLLLQAAPLVIIPLWQMNGRAPPEERRAFALAISLYVLAKAAELADHGIYNLTGIVSGHTIKHLLATGAAAVLTARLVGRLTPKRAI
jgi:hypothetical protein